MNWIIEKIVALSMIYTVAIFYLFMHLSFWIAVLVVLVLHQVFHYLIEVFDKEYKHSILRGFWSNKNEKT